MTRRRLSSISLVILSVALAILPAQAETTAERLQRLLWTYGNTGGGWTGADGAYSVPLPDGRTAWLFSDSFLGQVNEDGSRPTSAPFVHNSIVIQDGNQMTTLLPNGARTLIEPPDGAGFYWVGDGVVQGNELLVFVMRFVAAPAPYAFQQLGTDVARFSLPSMTLTGIQRMPLAFSPGVGVSPVSYGAAVMRDGGYDYVYGVEDIHADKYLHLARVPVGHLLDGSLWEYWTATGWSDVPALSLRILAGVANELSIERVGDTFALVAQVRSDIRVSTALAPQGPWGNTQIVFSTPETGTLFTYNAKAHDEFTTDDSLLITYNVNTSNLGNLYTDVNNYRPRFIQVPLERFPGIQDPQRIQRVLDRFVEREALGADLA